MNEPGTEMLPGPSMGLAPNSTDDFDYDYPGFEPQSELNGRQADLDDEARQTCI